MYKNMWEALKNEIVEGRNEAEKLIKIAQGIGLEDVKDTLDAVLAAMDRIETELLSDTEND